MIGLRKLVVRNVTIQAAAEAVSLACAFTVSALLSRHLGVAGFGAFNYAFAFIYFFVTLNDLGITTGAIREISQAPERAPELLGNLLSLRVAIAGGTFLLACAAIALVPMEPSLRLPILGLALLLPLNALYAPAVIFQTAMRFELAGLAQVITRLTGLALVLVMIRAGGGVGAMLGAFVVTDAIGVVLAWTLARRLVRVAWVVDRACWRRLALAAVPLGASLVLSALLNRVDFLMLERMVSIEAVGLYGAAYRVTSMMEKFPILVMGTLYPVMSILASSDLPRLRQVYHRGMGRLASIGLPFGALVVAVAPWLLSTAFGAPYAASAPALRWLVVATVCMYLAISGGYVLMAMDRARQNVLALGAGVVTNIGLNVVLIPWRGVEGAAMATAAGFAVVLGVTLVAVERSFAAVPAGAEAV